MDLQVNNTESATVMVLEKKDNTLTLQVLDGTGLELLKKSL